MTNKSWTANDVPDLSGHTIVITGGNSGIGLEAARVCVARRAHTILAYRSRERGTAIVEQLRTNQPECAVEAMHLDLGSLASVRSFASELQGKVDKLDALVNNAGIMMTPYQKTEDGFESQLGVNHLGHFALTGLVLPALLKAPAARVVNISSAGHRFGKMDFNNLMFEGGKGYSGPRAYGRSKLANLLFTRALQKRFQAAGANALAVAAHPGASATNLGRHLEGHWLVRLLMPLALRMVQSAAMGALPTLRAMVDPEARGGDYYGPGGFREQRGYPVKVGRSAAAQDDEAAERLWRVSEDLTAVRYAWSG